jgi:hypothetical protein
MSDMCGIDSTLSGLMGLFVTATQGSRFAPTLG